MFNKVVWLMVLWAWHLPHPSFGESDFKLGMDAVSYLGTSPPVDTSNQKVFSALSLEWKGVHRGNFLAQASVHGLLTLNNTDQSYLNVPEAYVATLGSGPIDIGIGRRSFLWSEMDRFWNLGIWQPRFRWDYLNPSETALLGFHAIFTAPKFRVQLFASPVHVPEQGAPFDLSHGNCVSKSPWFSCPGSEIEIFKGVAQFKYFLDMPPLSEIILNPGAALSVSVGDQTGFFGTVGAAYKPINQILLGLSDIQLKADQTSGSVKIHPRVLYHQVFSTELGYRSERAEVFASFMHERPIDDQAPEEWTTQDIYKTTLLSLGANWNLWGRGEAFPRMSLGYLRVLGQEDGVSGKAVEDEVVDASLFDQRISFRNVLSAGLRTPLPSSQRWHFNSVIFYDLADKGVILSSELRYGFVRQWTATLGVDLLSETAGVVGSSFISRYRANDRIRAGVSYVF